PMFSIYLPVHQLQAGGFVLPLLGCEFLPLRLRGGFRPQPRPDVISYPPKPFVLAFVAQPLAVVGYDPFIGVPHDPTHSRGVACRVGYAGERVPERVEPAALAVDTQVIDQPPKPGSQRVDD